MNKSATPFWLPVAASALCFAAYGSAPTPFVEQTPVSAQRQNVAREQKPVAPAFTQSNGPGEPVSYTAADPFILPSEIITRGGATYRAVKLLKMEPDGLSVEYTPEGGGMGLVKLKYEDLPEAFQLQFQYDVQKAKDYEAEQMRGIGRWRSRLLAASASAPSRTGLWPAKPETQPRTEQEAGEADALRIEKTVVLETKARNGDSEARRELAEWYAQLSAASGATEDRERALNALVPLAETGDAYSQLMLGNLLVGGEGNDIQDGLNWLRKAGEQGNPIAQRNLGILYREGRVVAQDTAEALKWYRLAADRGCFQTELAALDEAQGDFSEAFKWCEIAARAGDSGAIRLRDTLASKMSPGEVADARKRAAEFKPLQPGRSEPAFHLLAGE